MAGRERTTARAVAVVVTVTVATSVVLAALDVPSRSCSAPCWVAWRTP